MKKLFALIPFSLLAMGCPQDAFLHGSWENVLEFTVWNSDDDSVAVCEIRSNVVTFEKDGSYISHSTTREPEEVDNCGNDVETINRSSASGLYSVYSWDNDDQTWIHFWQTLTTSSYTVDGEEVNSSEDHDDEESDVSVVQGRDDQGPFLMFGGGWDGGATQFRQREE